MFNEVRSVKATATWADPDIRARRTAAIRAAYCEKSTLAKTRFEARIPKWVIPSLRDEYVEIMCSRDEFEAARHVRGLLAEMRK